MIYSHTSALTAEPVPGLHFRAAQVLALTAAFLEVNFQLCQKRLARKFVLYLVMLLGSSNVICPTRPQMQKSLTNV